MCDRITPMITRNRLLEIIHYDPGAGAFTWVVPVGRQAAGSRAGTVLDGGYLRIRIEGRNYRAHRLAWLYVYGDWPTMDLDHINRDKLDNRIDNLREVTVAENNSNRVIVTASGVAGVTKKRRRYYAQTSHNGKYYWIGSFPDKEQASAAYRLKVKELRGADAT